MKKKIIDIIGAGIGGLTTAIVLQQKGFHVRIFEQSNTLKDIGAGIILESNAMMIFDRLGGKDEIKKKGNVLHAMKITDANLDVISSMVGKMAHVENPFLGKLRNFLLSKTPVFVSRKQSEEIFRIS